MGLLGSAGRQDEKKLKLKYATFEGGFFHVFMDKNVIFLIFLKCSVRTKKLPKMNVRFFRVIFF